MQRSVIRFTSLLIILVISCENTGGNITGEPKQSKGQGLGKELQKGKAKHEGSGRSGRTSPVAVRAQHAEMSELAETIELVSVLSGHRQADVYSRVVGKISYIGPQEGKRVMAGEVLFRVDRSDAAESFLATPIISPISGWVGRWLVSNIGSQVTSQDPVVSVVDDASLKAVVMLPVDQWLRVSEATPVHIRIGDKTRLAKVISIARAAESTASRGSVTVEVLNADHQWKVGMVGMVTFAIDLKPRLVIPASALAMTDQGAFVFVAEAGKAKRVAVKFILIDNDRIEITDGLQAGAQVVTEGVNQIGDGLSITVSTDAVEPKAK